MSKEYLPILTGRETSGTICYTSSDECDMNVMNDMNDECDEIWYHWCTCLTSLIPMH